MAIALVLAISGCTGARAEFRPELYQKCVTVPVKFVKQRPNGCGIAALASILDYYGLEYPDIDGIYRDSIDGTRVISIVNYASQYGRVHVRRVGVKIMHDLLREGIPLIILRNNHYYVIKGFMPNSGQLVANDGYRENVLLEPPEEDDLTIYLERGDREGFLR